MINKFFYKLYLLLLINIIFPNHKLTLEEIYLDLKINKTIMSPGASTYPYAPSDGDTSIIAEESNVVSVGKNILGKEIFLSKKCAASWMKMQQAALNDSITISVLSGFRSYYKQYLIVRNKLNKGMKLDSILKENRLPGLSQHHSGNAIDIISNSYKLSAEFEKSSAYLWLNKNAHKYGFYLQYPKANNRGIIFEPWHWYFRE